MISFRRKKRAISRWDLQTPLLVWPDGTPYTINSACQGAMVLGGTGAGKSSGSLRTILKSYMSAGFGGLLTTVKPTDCAEYLKYAEETGRLSDVHVFSPRHDLRFNFIADEIARTPDPLGLVENLTDLLMTIASLGESGSSDSGENAAYFRLEATRLARNAILVLVFSNEVVSVPALHRLITTAPAAVEQVGSETWQKSSFLYQCLKQAEQRQKSASQHADYELALSYFLSELPALSPKTRSIVVSTLTSTTDILSRGAARDFLSAPTSNFSPADCYEGAIFIVDFPTLSAREIGKVIQTTLKHVWQTHHARRDISVNARPTFIVADEMQELLVDADSRFQAIARATRTACLYATQSISGMLDALGPHSEHKLNSLLTNLQTKFFHQNSDSKTVEYLQSLIGRSRQISHSGNQAHDENWLAPLFGTDKGRSSGFNEHYEFEVQASDLNSLARGGPPHRTVEGLLYQGGQMVANGRTWQRVSFRQG